ncbi:MAG: hypothetical protein ACOX3K_00820 [Bacilli bacterium]
MSNKKTLTLHTRHIPIEHLDHTNPTTITIKENGLCDSIFNIQKLQEKYISVIETRLVPIENNKLDIEWQRFVKVIKHIKKHNMGVGVFCWPQYIDKNSKITPLRCLEHNRESTIGSLWDPKLLTKYKKVYKTLSKYEQYLDFLYVGVYGDYGEVSFPSGVKHYLFSPKHGHLGLFCGDNYAKDSFFKYVKSKFKNIDLLNKKWQTNFANFRDVTPYIYLQSNQIAPKKAFQEWYCGSITKFAKQVMTIANNSFRNIHIGLPLGFADQPLEIGQIKSQIIKAASKHQILVRWTGLGFLSNYAKSNVLAKVVSSPAHFYHTALGCEAALKLNLDSLLDVMYEAISNGAEMIHNDPKNIDIPHEKWKKIIANYKISKPINNIGVFYPTEAEMLKLLDVGKKTLFPFESEQFKKSKTINEAFFDSFSNDDYSYSDVNNNPLDVYITRVAALRQSFDYCVVDSQLISDGALDKLEYLIIPISCYLKNKTQNSINKWIARGGKLILRKGVKLHNLDTLKEYNPRVVWLQYKTAFSLPPYDGLRRIYGENTYITIHEDFISVLDKENTTIKYYTTKISA